MEMYHLFKPYGMRVLPESKESFDFHGRWICTGTEGDNEILCDLPEWCPLPSHSAIQQPGQQECSTCPNKENAESYVMKVRSDIRKAEYRKEMDQLKKCCSECNHNGQFVFSEKDCNGYSGGCEDTHCKDFEWWHSKCRCPLIRQYDRKKRREQP